jgi:uncharacterized protein (DUF1330 family)
VQLAAIVPSAGLYSKDGRAFFPSRNADIATVCGALRLRGVLSQHREGLMNKRIAVGLGILAGAAIGGITVGGLYAQSKSPGAYAIIDISEITAPDLIKQIVEKAGPAVASAGGQYIVRTSNITPLLGTPPKRVVILAFDSVDKAKAWYESPTQKEINAITDKALKARWFIADGTLN